MFLLHLKNVQFQCKLVLWHFLTFSSQAWLFGSIYQNFQKDSVSCKLEVTKNFKIEYTPNKISGNLPKKGA